MVCLVSLWCWLGRAGLTEDWRGMWSNEEGLNDGTNSGLLPTESFGEWPLKLLPLVKVVSLQLCPSTSWFGFVKKQKATTDKPTDKSAQCFARWMTWLVPQRSQTSSNARGGGPAEPGEDEVGQAGGREGGCWTGWAVLLNHTQNGICSSRNTVQGTRQPSHQVIQETKQELKILSLLWSAGKDFHLGRSAWLLPGVASYPFPPPIYSLIFA